MTRWIASVLLLSTCVGAQLENECLTTIATADADFSETLNRSEFITFRRTFCDDDNTNVNLTLSEAIVFSSLSCLCQTEPNADPNCCTGDNAFIRVDDVLTAAENGVPSDRLSSVCVVVGATCGEKGPTPTPMSDAPSDQSSDVPSDLSSDNPSDELTESPSLTPSSSPVATDLPTGVPEVSVDEDGSSAINNDERSSSVSHNSYHLGACATLAFISFMYLV